MIIIGSYHKTGTALFRNIWKQYYKYDSTEYFFTPHFNRIPDDDIRNNRCVVIIRNPYEIIMSGSRYHQISKEKWLHVKKKEYNNNSYQEHILSLNDDDKILFEMNSSSKRTINFIYNDIKNRNFNNNVLFIKLEELYDKTKLKLICERIDCHLDNKINLGYLKKCFEYNLSKNFHRTNTENKYTYTDKFKDIHYSQFATLFPSDLMDLLGY